jgi:integrase
MARREYQNPPLKKTAGANPQWYIRVRVKVLKPGKSIGKKQTRIYLGACADIGIREANRIRAEKLQEINGQVYAIPSHVPLNDFILTYNAKHLPTLGKGTQAKYRQHITHHIQPEFGKYKLCAIGTEEIQDWLNRKDAAGLSWWTRNDLRNIMSSIFTKAYDWGYWKERNPAEATTCGRKKTKREKRILTDAQFMELLEALPADLALIVRLADCTGMRISEILGLRWRNVDLDSGWLYVRERHYRGDDDVPKSEKAIRRLPLADLRSELYDHARSRSGGAESFVFGYADGTPYDDRNLNQHFLRKIAKAKGWYFQGFGFHSLRRGLITGAQEDGASTAEAQMIAGHSKPSMTADYTVLQDRRKQEIVQKRQRRLQIVERKSA